MLLKSSRYYKLKTVDGVKKDGQTVKTLTLRRLPSVGTISTDIKGNDRLDIMAQRRYQNGTMFWHIADSNTELQANELVKTAGRTIEVPK